MADMKVAEEILHQLGGSRFIVMTGAKEFVADDYSLRMRLPKNMSKANVLTIKLEADDTYTMIFRRVTNGRLNKKTYNWIEGKDEVIREIHTVYCDTLQSFFTEVTGLYTRL